MIPSPESNV